ncbi:unnamed protein product [Rodentolepis nana]|uniref:ELYS-bb domain-containing protein n=1 Tax=Rodentolepis nana TaxID=102285 RepID=A0A0R3T176_RODNA|nr:unnamed protein product [Rodentolepis nana]
MQSVESTISSAFLDCYDVALHDPSKPSDHFSSYPRFVFSPTGSIICSFSPNQLYCRFPNDKVFSWTPSEFSLFSTVLKNWPSDAPRSWTIADATFLPYSSQILLLLAPPESGKPLRSIICFIDLNDGIVVSFQRFICVRGRAEKIHVVSTEPSTLPGFQGAVVVALEHGQIALLDLCLGWNIPDITYLETSVCISVEQCLESLAEDQPISTMSPKMEHALVILNASRISLNNFYYQTPRNETIGRFASVSVNVTLLNYVSQIKALVVGFSFGGWQLWSLTKLKLLFTFRDLPPMPVPVVECAFTEPSDDPRYYCYLWIGWQSIINHSNSISDSTGTSGTANPKVGLFQLGFRERTERIQPETEDTLYEYDNFYGGTRRLSTILTPLKTSLSHEPPHWKAQGPLLTSIQSLGANYTPNFGLRSNRLTALVWRAAPNIIRIGLFDLDRWYHAQMPSGIRSDNSFFTVYDAFLDQPRAYPLTAYVLPHTIFAFWANVYRMELSAFKICGEVSAVQGPLRGYQDLRKPLLECQLRPSTHGFKALVPFIIDYSVAFSTQTFISRQESALREISSAISKALTSNSTTFDPTEWITEAAACGLLQEFEDSDIDILQALKEVEGSDWILRLAIGLENPPQELLKQIELIDGEEEWEGGDFESFNPSPQKDRRKRRILPLRDTDDHRRGVKRPRSVVENETTRGVKYLPPAWVIIANCLLDHGMYEDIKKLDVLISSQEELNFNPKVFMRRWLWLKWLGKKYCLEELLMPIFESEKEVKSKLTYEDGIKELCLCFQSLRVLADIAKVVMSPSFIIDGDFENSEAVSAEAKLKVIQSLAEYTRPVSLLIRLGLLPQSAHFKPRSSALSPYNYEEINGLIVKLQGMQNASITRPPFITDCLLDHLRSILNTSDQIDTASLNALTSSYPPKHLQSICALWRCFDMSTASSGLPTHLALLCFILFDAVTVTALHEDATQAIEDNDDDDEIKQDPPIHVVGRLRLVEVDKNAAHFVPSSAVLRPSPVARAVKLQQYVVNQVGNEFPNFGKFVSTVRTLWLLDRFRFSDVLCSRLSILATGQVTDLAHLPEVFPNQSRLVADFCARYGQTELAARFDPHFNLNQTAGCVVPGLYQARQLYYQKSDSHEAAAILIKVANSFKKSKFFLLD